MPTHIQKKLYLPKETWIGWASSMNEAYNMAIYSFLAPFLAKMLFHGAGSSNALFFSYGLIFVGSCFLYPLGAIYYGFIGDKEGRQKTCTSSTLGLAMATGAMAFVPFDFLNDKAWFLFLLLIGAQHFFSGGEYHGSIVFSLEHAKEKQSGLLSALSCLFAVFGLVAANGLATYALLSQNEFLIRGCFLIGALGGLLSYLLKNYCSDTPAFIEIPREYLAKVDLKSFIKEKWRTLVRVIFVLAFFIVNYSFVFIFLPLVSESMQAQSFDTFKSLILYGLSLVVSGFIADRIGLKNTMMLGTFLFSLVIIPLSFFCQNFLVLQSILTVLICFVIGPIHSWLLQQFEVAERCRGIFISAAVGTSIFGGSTVPLCLKIYESYHSLVVCALYPLAVSVCSLLYLCYGSEKKAEA